MSQNSLPQTRTKQAVLFPEPEDGDVLEITPPPLYWLQVEGVSGYRVVVENGSGETVVDQTVDQNFLILREILPPGKYRWNLLADGRERGWYAFEIAANALEHVVPTAEEVLAQLPDVHPRHVYYPEDIETVVAKYPDELVVLKRNIEAAIVQGLPPRPRFHRTDGEFVDHPRYREAFGTYRDYVDRNLVACALGHVLLKDRAAADYARSAFLNIIDWNPEGPCAVDGQWGDEIGLSNCRSLFAVYDWIYDLYTEDQHLYIQATLTQYARQILRLLKRRNFFNNPGDNHSGRIPAYLGEAALVLHGLVDSDEVKTWLQYALDIYGSFFPHYGGRDGGWAQGTFYGSSYTKWYLPFFFAVERHTGFSFLERPVYRNLSHFFMHFSPPGWETHPFCDGYWCLPEDEEWPGFFAQDPYGVYAERYGPDVAKEFYAKTPLPELFKLHLMDVFRVPFQTRAPDSVGQATQSRAFRDAGFVSMHSQIEDPENDTAVLVRASKFGSVSHMHADQGSFAIMSKGKGLISPSGYFGRGASTPHHKNWTHHTVAHNCVLVNSQGQRPHTFENRGHIEYLKDDGVCVYTRLDLREAYLQLKSYWRTIFLIRPGVVIVYDELESDKPTEYAWLAHTLSPPQLNEDWVRVNRESASMKMRVFTQGDLNFEWTDQFGVDLNEGVPEHLHRQQPSQFHLTWTAAGTANRRFAAVIAVNGTLVEACSDVGKLQVDCEGQQLKFALDPTQPAGMCLNGVMV